ncbi:MAG TPA: DUF4446 family protein [Chthonomonadales bacterium]|nr:DUF4446 family protein [Chthonomonadales bacterium]
MLLSSTPLSAFLRGHLETVLGSLLVVTLLTLIGLLATRAQVGRLTRKYERLMRGSSGTDLEQILEDYLGIVTGFTHRVEELERIVRRLGEQQQSCVQRVGLVRFDAFEDVGGEQSFAVVLLDAHRSGVAISSVYSRNEMRVYAKRIHNGKPSHPLTQEEEQAMLQAEET